MFFLCVLAGASPLKMLYQRSDVLANRSKQRIAEQDRGRWAQELDIPEEGVSRMMNDPDVIAFVRRKVEAERAQRAELPPAV